MLSHAPPGYECPLCLLAAGGETARVGPDHIVERTEETLTFVAPKWWPNNKGAVLVVPVEHHENLYALPDRLGTPLYRAMRRAAVALKHAYSCDGTSTRQHNEPAGNQDVWHFHVHVFPRFVGDDLYRLGGEWVLKEEMSRYSAPLRAALEQLSDSPQ